MEWIENDDYLIGKININNLNFYKDRKICCFDLDGTIVNPTTGKFSKEDNDWVFAFDNCIQQIQKYESSDYSIIIITNQGGIGKGKVNVEKWKCKLEKIFNKLNVKSLSIFASKNENKYRKPIPTFWNEFINGDKSTSLYIGDACGREKTKEFKKDFADTDLKFALNIGIQFNSPEEFFNGYDSRKKNISYVDLTKLDNRLIIPKIDSQIILMIGFPASGKSYLSSILEKLEYSIVSRDKLKQMQKCYNKMDELLKQNKKVLIDNTNLSTDERKPFIDIAKKYKINIDAIWMKTSLELAKHNNQYRSLITNTTPLPKIVYNVANKRFIKPSKDEGFNNIHEVNFSFDKNDPNYFLKLY